MKTTILAVSKGEVLKSFRIGNRTLFQLAWDEDIRTRSRMVKTTDKQLLG